MSYCQIFLRKEVCQKLNLIFCQNDNQLLFVCPGQKEETSGSTSIPVNDLKTILSLAREQYLKMIDSTLPSPASCLTDRLENTAATNPSKKETIHKPAVFSHPFKATVCTYKIGQTLTDHLFIHRSVILNSLFNPAIQHSSLLALI